MDECYFCGETNPLVLQEHHIVPLSFDIVNSFDTIMLCANCHIKIHRVLNPLKKHLKIITTSKTKEPSEDQLLQDALIIVKNCIERQGHNLMLEEELLRVHSTPINGYEIKNLIAKLKKDGIIYVPKEGFLRVT